MTTQFTWTTKPPTKPGYYWHKCSNSPHIVRVLKYGKSLYIGDGHNVVDEKATEWAGPIPEPVEERRNNNGLMVLERVGK